MKLINFLKNISPCQLLQLVNDDGHGNTVFMGIVGQIQNSIMFNEWEVTFHIYHNDTLIIWIK